MTGSQRVPQSTSEEEGHRTEQRSVRPSDSTELVEVSHRGPQPNRPRRRARARARSAVRSTALGLVRPLCSACSFGF